MPPLDLTALYREGLAAQQAGRTGDALAIYDRILDVQPAVPEVLFQKARCVAMTDRAAAADVFRQALALKPKEAAIWQGLHGALHGPARVKLEKDAQRKSIILGSEADTRPIFAALKKGQAIQAEAAATRLAKLAPAAFWPAYALGAARLALLKPAVAPLEAAIARDPSHGPARLALARAYLAIGRHIKAETVLALGETSPEGTLLLARILRDTARAEEAVELLQSAKIKAPSGPAALALSLAQAGKGPAALKAANVATSAGASEPILLRATALAAEEAGDIAAAEAMIDQAVKHPTASLLTHRAQLHQSAGEFAEADAALTVAIAMEPTLGEAFRAYMNGRKVRVDDPMLPKLDSALARANLKASDRAGLHFASAKARGDLGEDEAVFPHLETANRLIAKAYPYGFESDLTEVRALVADWDKLKPMPSSGADDPVIFVTGLPRSGTTLVETILGAHSTTTAGGEMPFLTRALAPCMEALRFGEITPAELATSGSRYLRAAKRRAGDAPVILDKSIATFSRIGHAARALPGSQFILVKRDPRDVGLSLFRNMFPEGLHRYAYDLSEIARYIRLHDTIVDFWKSALPDRVHVVEYEALTAAPDREIRALLQAVGLPWEDACLAPEATGRRIQTLSFAQARQPIGTSAVAGWTRFERELKPLTDGLDVTFKITS